MVAAMLGTALGQAALAENQISMVRSDAPELAAFGDYTVGVQTRRFVHADQVDIINTTASETPRYDRPLTVEIWYPARSGTPQGGTYRAILRDGKTEVTLSGRAARDAPPHTGDAFPLIVISHGYPGNRFLMSHLGENLASKGYVTVSIDHTDSTYSDQGAFGSTLYHRPLDQRFVIDQMAGLDGPLGDIVDAGNTAVIGFSMGGYGALVYGGAGVTHAAVEASWSAPNALLERHLSGSESHDALIDARVKAIVAIGPWGMNADIWDDVGLAGLQKPLLLIAGSVDDVSVYAAIRQIFDETVGTERHLLTFENANHNAAAPIPAPVESWAPVDNLEFAPAEHYSDPVWDTVRMNNIAQHFTTAFLDIHLKQDVSRARFLDLVPQSSNGVFALDDAGKETADHTYWAGFPARTAAGLRFETKAKDQ
jgi:predicted dienelactone hydrolase